MKILIPIGAVLALILFLFFSDDSEVEVVAPSSEQEKTEPASPPQKSNEELQRDLAIKQAVEEIEKDSKDPIVTPEAAKLYEQARATAQAGNFSDTTEALHNAYSESPELIDQTLKDQAFRNYRTEDDFRKLLNIHGRDTFKDLGLGPIILPK